MKKTTFKWQIIEQRLTEVYGSNSAIEIVSQLKKLAADFKFRVSTDITAKKLTEKDIALVVYANSIIDRTGQKKPLQVLADFIDQFKLNEVFTIVHILPFYPWDTDRGFSVVDYYQVNPEYGDWQDIKRLSQKVKLMFDFVINHASVNNPLVQKALIERHLPKTDSRYQDYVFYKDFVIAYSEKNKPSEAVLKKLNRPRPYPVLTPYLVFETKEKSLKAILGDKLPVEYQKSKILGQGYVWTTFSRAKNNDGSEATRQVDLNYSNPQVFLEAVKIILFYIKQGAKILRLDAPIFLWKELGTSSVHHQKTHYLLQVIRTFFSIVAPEILFVVEVNDQQDRVLSYLGQGRVIESDLVYQFTNFILSLYSLINGNTNLYCQWYQTTKRISGRQLVTVLGSHDGINIKPLRGLLTDNQIENFAQKMVNDYQVLPNYGFLQNNKKIIYELCSTPWHLINDHKYPKEIAFKRYFLILALGLMVRGLPEIYFNGLFGAKNYLPKTGLDEKRTVNRQIFDIKELSQLLKTGFHKQIINQVLRLLKIKTQIKYFSPWAFFPQVRSLNNNQVLEFSLVEDKKVKFLAWYNFSSINQLIKTKELSGVNILTSKKITKKNEFLLAPFEFIWLKS